jgi:uncharacterized membrane protein YkgB
MTEKSALSSFLGTVTIIPLFLNAWAAEGGGFPAMYLPVAFLMKDVVLLAVSIYLLKQDVMHAALEVEHDAHGASRDGRSTMPVR